MSTSPQSMDSEVSDMSDDEERVRAWLAGDRQAGMALVQENYDAVVRFFRSKAGSDAEDLVQRTFLTCSERIHSFRATGSFRAFLFGIARNVLLEHIRGKVRDRGRSPDFEVHSIADLQPGVWTQAAQRDQQRVLVHALQLIPVESQILVELYYWEDLSVAELSVALEIPAGTVKSRLHRARELLQDAVERAPGTTEGDGRSASHMLESWLVRIRNRQDGSDPA